MTLYPDGYGTAEVTLEQMEAKHGGRMHPEFARRFFAWIVSEGGRMGVGGGWRLTQPVKPGFAPPGMSFHETQTFASGFAGYAAVDLVHRQPGQVHRSPTWAETASAREFGLHTFVTGEPWHIQCIEMRGYTTWVNAGRPDPQPITLPGDKPSPPPIDPTDPPTNEVDTMFRIRYRDSSYKPGAYTGLICNGTQLGWIGDGNADIALGKGGARIVEDLTTAELDGLIKTLQTTSKCPPEWVNTPRGAAWTANRG